jgi:hypothetical protein
MRPELAHVHHLAPDPHILQHPCLRLEEYWDVMGVLNNKNSQPNPFQVLCTGSPESPVGQVSAT